MFGKKKKPQPISYDPDIQYPVIRASICTGEQVAGFKDKANGHFTEIMLIRSQSDLEAFKALCGVDEVKTEY